MGYSEAGEPLRLCTHPQWLTRFGSTSALRTVSRATALLGLSLDVCSIPVSAPALRLRPPGGAIGGWGSALAGLAVVPGGGTVIDGFPGGLIGSGVGQAVERLWQGAQRPAHPSRPIFSPPVHDPRIFQVQRVAPTCPAWRLPWRAGCFAPGQCPRLWIAWVRCPWSNHGRGHPCRIPQRAQIGDDSQFRPRKRGSTCCAAG